MEVGWVCEGFCLAPGEACWRVASRVREGFRLPVLKGMASAQGWSNPSEEGQSWQQGAGVAFSKNLQAISAFPSCKAQMANNALKLGRGKNTALRFREEDSGERELLERLWPACKLRQH